MPLEAVPVLGMVVVQGVVPILQRRAVLVFRLEAVELVAGTRTR
jgi:hypothetical protein